MNSIGKISEVSIIAIVSLAAFAALYQLAPLGKTYPQLITNSTLLASSYVAIYFAVLAVVVFVIALALQSAQLIGFNNKKGIIAAQVSKENLLPGDAMHLEGNYSGNFNNGYIKATFRGFDGREELVFLHYNELTGLGQIKGRKQKETFIMKWDIPTDFATGDCHVKIELSDVVEVDAFRKSIHSHRLAEVDIIIPISAKQGSVEIQKILPADRDLRGFNRDSLPMWGWVCVTLSNTSEVQYPSCSGEVRTDAGVFPMYEYDKVPEDSKDNNPLPFSIEPDSTKLVCANIISRTPKAKVLVDLGQIQVSKELEVEAS